MPEPKVERIAARIATRLSEIVGDGGTTFWYTPGIVQRVDDWEDVDFEAMPPPPGTAGHSAPVGLWIRQGFTTPEELTGDTVENVTEFWILIAIRDPNVIDDERAAALQGLVIAPTFMNRALGDVAKQIRRCYSLPTSAGSDPLATNWMAAEDEPWWQPELRLRMLRTVVRYDQPLDEL